jgi:outer membrane protein TolC
MTLEQILELAQTRSESIGIARQGVQRAQREQAKARSGLFPQLGLSASYDRALASEFEEVFKNFGNVGGASDGGGSIEDLPFGRENTWRVALSFSQTLYSGGRLGAQAALAEAGRESAELALTTAQGQLLFDVTQAYYEAALSDRLVAIAEATLEQADATLRQATAAFDAGTQPEFEVLRARVSRDTQNPVLIRQRVNREVALLRLKQLLDFPADADVRLADSLSDDALPPPSVFAARLAAVESRIGAADPIQAALRSDAPLTDRTVIHEAAATVRLREAGWRAVEAERRPSVSLTSTYGRVTYPTGPLWGFDSLRTNWTVGASMQLPLLTGGRQRADEQIAEANVGEARLRLRQVEELAALDTRSSWAELLAARAAWEATAGTVQQASRAYEIADVRYRAGVSTQLELSDSRLLLQQAEANRAQAARDLQIARARVALLPNLPLATGVPSGTSQPRPSVPAPPVPPPAPPPPAGGVQMTTASAQGGAPQFGGR